MPTKRLLLILVSLVVASLGVLVNGAAGATAPRHGVEGAVASGQLAGPAAVTDDEAATTGKAVGFADGSSPSPDGFVHPGIGLDTSQLDFVRSKIAAGAEPWASAFRFMMNRTTGGNGGPYASLTYQDQPVPEVKCVGTAGNGSLDVGCRAMQDDSIAAYTDALAWYYTRDPAYAEKAISIMNDWSSTLRKIWFDPTYVAGLLYPGWSGEVITKAAEIIKGTYDGWSGDDISRFSAMLTNVYLPNVDHGWTGGGANWLMTLADATLKIGVFTGDRATFDLGVSQWRAALPSIIFQSSDVNPYPKLKGYPIPPPGTWLDNAAAVTPAKMNTYWYNPGTYKDGLEGETCRDMAHATFGLDSMIEAAETARLQGVDLYAGNTKRMVDGFEFNARYFAQMLSTGSTPSWLCGGRIDHTEAGYQPGWETGFNALHDRLGIPMPYTEAFMTRYTRPAGLKARVFMAWEQLTNGNSVDVCDAPDRSLGAVTLDTSVDAAGSYRVWTRVKAATDTGTTFALQVDGSCAITAGGGAIDPDRWTWVSQRQADPSSSITAGLKAGPHSVTLSAKSPGLAVDSVLLTDDPDCVPVGDGSNCLPDTEPPSTPDDLQTDDVTPTGMTLSWAAATDDFGVDHYVVSRDGQDVGSADGPGFVDHGLAPGTSYSYTVRAVDAAGNESAPSAAVATSTTADTTAPSAPSGLAAASVGDTSLTMSWTASDDDVGVDHYVVSRDGQDVGSADVPAFVDRDLAPGTSHSYTVRAVDAAGNESAPSPTVDASTTTPDTTAPSPPSSPTASSVGETSLTISWAPAADDVGVDHYVVSRNGSVVASPVGTSATDSGLHPSTTYTYSVTAVDAAGNVSPASTDLVVTTSTDTVAPSVPAGLRVVAVTTSTIGLSWSPATDNVAVDRYEIFRGGVKVATSSGTTYTDTALAAGTSYSYTVAAVDAAGNHSAPAAAVTGTTATPPDTTAPTAPTTFTAKVSALGQVSLSWSAATDNVKVTGYRLTRGGSALASPTGLAYQDSGLTAGATYTYALTAVDAAGNKSAAKSVTVTMPLASAPRGSGFAGAYFNNTTLSGAAVGRLDPTIGFTWGTGAPAPGINATNFSVRWTGRLTPKTTGTYTFYTQTHDGVRLYLDDKLLINHWSAGSASLSASAALVSGHSYNLRAEYYETTGSAVATLQWSGPGIARTTLPATVMGSDSSGLSASYFTNTGLTGSPAVQRLDGAVNFAWGTGAPDARIPADNFGVRWSGRLVAPVTSAYTFYTDSDDGIRVWVNGQLLVDNWTTHALTTNTSAKINLVGGTAYDVRVEHFENTGPAIAKLYWSYGSVVKTIVPATALRDR